MIELTKPMAITGEAEIERIYHEIKQTLRVTGINSNFRTWARSGFLFPVLWDAVRPNAETRAFESAADCIRAQAAGAAQRLGKLNIRSQLNLGESQIYQIQAALDLYHYINAKLLILSSALWLALSGEGSIQNKSGGDIELIERGIPARMYPMEMVADEPEDQHVRDVFEDIKRTLNLPLVIGDYRTLALWPNYLEVAWQALKPITISCEYQYASHHLLHRSRARARELPYHIAFTRNDINGYREAADELMASIALFERVLPSLIINIALLELEWHPMDIVTESPFPAKARLSESTAPRPMKSQLMATASLSNC